jgi:hypothetical protein
MGPKHLQWFGQGRRAGRLPPVLLVLVCTAFVGLLGCEAVDKARMKLVGVTVDHPEAETAEWVLAEALQAAVDPDAEKGWERFQQVLHSQERTPAALASWQQFGWPRLRKQARHYLDEEGRFVLRDFRNQQNEGIDFFLENRTRELPTPCSVYLDYANNKLWRIKRCSL